MPATQHNDNIGRTVAGIFAGCIGVLLFLGWSIVGPLVGIGTRVLGLAWGLRGPVGLIVAVAAVYWVVRNAIDAYVEHHHTKLTVDGLVRHRAPAPVSGELARTQDVRTVSDHPEAA